MVLAKLMVQRLSPIALHACTWQKLSVKANPPMVSYSKGLCPKNICPKPKRKPRKKNNKLIIAAVLVGTVGTICYGKYDPDFRKNLNQYLPFFDGLVAFVFCEKQSYMESFRSIIGLPPQKKCPPQPLPKPKPKEKVKIDKKKQEQQKEEIVDCRAKPVEIKEIKTEEKEPEKKIEFKEHNKPTCLEPPPPPDDSTKCYDSVEPPDPCAKERDPAVQARLDKFNVKSFDELMFFLNFQYTNSIKKTRDTTKHLQSYIHYVVNMLACSVDHPNPNLWYFVEKRTLKINKELKASKRDICDRIKNIEALKSLFDETCIVPDKTSRTVRDALKAVKIYDAQFTEAQEELLIECRYMQAAEEFWRRTKAAREKTAFAFDAYIDDFDVLDKKLKKIENLPEMDMYLIEMRDRLIHVDHAIKEKQMEFTCELEKARKHLAEKLGVRTMSPEELTRQAQKMVNDMKNMLVKRDSDIRSKEIKKMVKQNEAKVEYQACRYGQMMKFRLKKQRELMQCLMEKQIKEKREKLSSYYNHNLEMLDERIDELTAGFHGNVKDEKSAREAQLLWLSVRALDKALNPACRGLVPLNYMRPLNQEICAVRNAATKDDKLVDAVLATVSDEVIFRGVLTEQALKERFYRIEKLIRNMAMVPENGGPLYLYMMSYFQSALLMKKPLPLPKQELSSDRSNPDKLNTYDVLQRARYFIDRNNYVQAYRYMNLLQGAARCIANDWLQEMKIRLETLQATKILIAYASAKGVRYISMEEPQDSL